MQGLTSKTIFMETKKQKVWNGVDPANLRCMVLYSLVQNGGHGSTEEGRWLRDEQREEATSEYGGQAPVQGGVLRHFFTPKDAAFVGETTAATLPSQTVL